MSRHYLWFCALSIVVGILLGFGAPVRPVRAADAPGAYEPGEVVVKLKPAAYILSIATAYGLDPSPTAIEQLGPLPIYRLRIIDGTSPLAKAAALQANPLVAYAEPNYLGAAPEGNQQSAWAKGGDAGAYSRQWAGDVLRLATAHTITRGAGITVAVLDTGADLGHPALAGRLAPGFDFVDSDPDPSEEGVYGHDSAYGHGTHVAGLVALAAPAAKIMPLRILRPDGTGNSWLLAQGVRYAASMGAGVINISYSVTQRSLLVDEILAAVAYGDGDGLHTILHPGAIVVAAAGNSGGTAPEYPAAEGVAGVLAVAASTQTDTLASFSTRGPWVHVAAPGVRILSSVPLDSGFTYAAWSGTSMAAPLAAGTAALVRAAYPALSPAEVADRLVSTAAPIDSPVPRRVDAAAAVGLPAASE